MRIVVAQPRARIHYAAPRIREGAGLLERFFTECRSGDEARRRSSPPAMHRWLRLGTLEGRFSRAS